MLDAKSPALPVIVPTEPIGSIPRPLRLIEAFSITDSADPMLDPLYEEAIRDTIARFEATGSPVITDGEQRKRRKNSGAPEESSNELGLQFQ